MHDKWSVISKKECRKYQGVEGNNWYLNDLYPESLGKYFDDYIDKAWCTPNYVDVCSEEAFINAYIELSRSRDIKFRMLLCETEKPYPRIDKISWDKKFIGYDYAYSGGSYYSAVLNDICSRRIEEFADIQLNEYGLFSEIDGLNKFIKSRNLFAQASSEYVIEMGSFVVYKLFEINTETVPC